MNVVVTGATSFIGAVTTGRLLRAGHRVCAVVRPGSENLGHLWACVPEDGKDRLRVVSLDMERIEELGRELLPEGGTSPADGACGIWDGWIQIGWDGAGSENRMKREVQQANVRNSLASVRMASELGCRRFLFTGSQAEYGIHRTVITEETPCNPVSEYGKAKADFANLAKELCKSRKMEYIHTRIFSVYGPGDHPWSLVNTCLSTWQRGGHMELSECTQQWNFLYIEDAAEAIVRLLTAGRSGIYNIAGEDTRVLREFIEEMYALCGSRGSYAYGMRKPNAEGPASLIPDITKLKAETGWQPATSFTEGIYETMHCLRESTSGEPII